MLRIEDGNVLGTLEFEPVADDVAMEFSETVDHIRSAVFGPGSHLALKSVDLALDVLCCQERQR